MSKVDLSILVLLIIIVWVLVFMSYHQKKSYKTILAGILIKLTLTQIIYLNKQRNELMNNSRKIKYKI